MNGRGSHPFGSQVKFALLWTEKSENPPGKRDQETEANTAMSI